MIIIRQSKLPPYEVALVTLPTARAAKASFPDTRLQTLFASEFRINIHSFLCVWQERKPSQRNNNRYFLYPSLFYTISRCSSQTHHSALLRARSPPYSANFGKTSSSSIQQSLHTFTMAFGDFDWLCMQAAVPLCSVVGSVSNIEFGVGIEATCYARNIELANTIIFQGAASFMHIVALIMTVIMILHVRSKYTAVGMNTCVENPRWVDC